jgi:hypothetical protein
MSNIITKNFKINNAKAFKENYANVSYGNSLYMFLARPNPWNNDSIPPDPTDDLENYAKTWDEIISLKRVLLTDIANVVKRRDWKYGIIYDTYDHEDKLLLEKNFYVLNSDKLVYKCIDNGQGRASLIEPTGTSPYIFTTSDGYKWKYLYTINQANQLKFLTDNWMPVFKDDTVASNAIDGGIEHIKIINGGTDYSVFSNVIIAGDGANANISIRSSLGVISGFSYNNTGTGYRYANSYIVDPRSSGKYANIKAIVSPTGGHGYDPVTELGAYYVMINSKTSFNEGFGDFPQGFTYRKLGLIKNPIDKNNILASDITLLGLPGANISNVIGTFLPNENIEGANSSANVYLVSSNVTSGNGYIRYIQSFETTNNWKSFIIGETIIGKKSGTTAKISNVLYSEIKQDKGEIIYIENRTPITRAIDQTDNLHLVIEF